MTLVSLILLLRKEPSGGDCNARPGDGYYGIVLRPGRRLRPPLIQEGVLAVLYLTAVITVAALVYLVYAMLRPESF